MADPVLIQFSPKMALEMFYAKKYFVKYLLRVTVVD